MVGTWDDGVFTLTEPATAPSPPPDEEPHPVSPCPEPPGGWEIPNPSRAGQDDMERAIAIANGQKSHGGGWIGWLIPDDEITEQASSDPDNFVLNVLTTGDPATTEAVIREVWGGKLCVATAEHTARELNRIAREVEDTAGMVTVWTDDVRGTVELGVWVATETLWEELVAEYGAGVVELDGMLAPVDP